MPYASGLACLENGAHLLRLHCCFSRLRRAWTETRPCPAEHHHGPSPTQPLAHGFKNYYLYELFTLYFCFFFISCSFLHHIFFITNVSAVFLNILRSRIFFSGQPLSQWVQRRKAKALWISGGKACKSREWKRIPFEFDGRTTCTIAHW